MVTMIFLQHYLSRKVTSGQLTDRQYKTRMVKEVLEGAGLDQAITYSLVSKEDATAFCDATGVKQLIY